MASGWAKIALFLAPDDPWAGWYREALEHVGLKVEILEHWVPSELARTHVVLLCGRGRLNPLQREGLTSWVENGGCLVASGSTWGIEPILGLVERTARHHSVGYATPVSADRLWPEDAVRTKFFGATSAQADKAIVLGLIGDAPVLTRRRFGRGHAIYDGIHLGQTTGQMALGCSVEVDGIGALDGSAPIDDGVLRAEDGHVLDYDSDRTTVEGGDAPFFGEAYVDIVRDIWIRAVFQAIDLSEHTAAAFWYWPNNANAVASLTLDVHDFEVDRVIGLQRVLQMFGCPATWMVAMPGYAADVYRALRAMEHEVGLLFQIEDTAGWHEERLKIQFTSLCRLASSPAMTSVRVDQGQWRGWTKFYESCEVAGPRLSLNKMGRQPGTAGFLFGTSHPYFPVRSDGKECTVCEIPGQIWAPGHVTGEHVAAELARLVDQRNGMLTIGMTPESIADSKAVMALRRILSACKELRMSFVKPGDIYRFERAKRHTKTMQKHVGDSDLIQLASETEISGLTVMVTGPSRFARDRHGDLGAFEVERFGTKFSAVTIDVPPRMLTDVEWIPSANMVPKKAA